jgi:hypothetical protein
MLPGATSRARLACSPGLGSQRPALVSDGLVDSRDIQFDLGDRLGQCGDLLLERLTLRASAAQACSAQDRPW